MGDEGESWVEIPCCGECMHPACAILVRIVWEASGRICPFCFRVTNHTEAEEDAGDGDSGFEEGDDAEEEDDAEEDDDTEAETVIEAENEAEESEAVVERTEAETSE